MRRRRLRRWLVVIALTLVLLVGGAVLFLRVQFSGPALATWIVEGLNREMSGRIEMGSVDWDTAELSKVVTGGWIPFTIHDVIVYDRTGKKVMHVEKVTLEVDIHAAMFGRHDLVFRNVVFDGGWAILEEIPKPDPLHAYDRVIMSLFDAFYPAAKPGWSVGVAAAAPPVFDIRNFEVRNIDLQVRLAYSGKDPDTGRVTGHALVVDTKRVSGKGFFYSDPSDPLVPKVYFSMGDEQVVRADSATITIEQRWDENGNPGTFDYQIPLATLVMTRFAQLPVDWPRDPVANNLDMYIVGVTPKGAMIVLDGSLVDYWDSPYGGTFDATATIRFGGDLAHDTFDTGMGGENLTVVADVSGPIMAPRLHANLKSLEYSVSLDDEQEPLKLILDELDVSFDLATESGSLDKTVGRVLENDKEGEVSLSAKFGPGCAKGSETACETETYFADAHLTISRDKPIDLVRWLPPEVSKAFGSELSGSLHSYGDSAYRVEVDELDLHLGQLHIDDGTITAENEFSDIHFDGLRAKAGATRVTVDGDMQPEREAFQLELALDSGDLSKWLARFGAPPIARTARTSPGHPVTVHGTLADPAAEGHVALGGVEVIDDLATTFAYSGQKLVIQRGVSTSIGDIKARGTIDLRGGSAKAEDFRITGRGVDLAKVAGMPAVIDGRVDVDAVANGPLDARIRLDATVKSDDVSLMGQRASKLRACYNHDPSDPLCVEASALSPADSKQCVEDAKEGGRCLIAGISRADGGVASMVARTDRKGNLAGHVGVSELPLDAVAELAGQKELPAGGAAELSIDLGGTLKAPTAEGTIGLLRTWVYGSFLGDEQLEVRVAGSDDPRAECAPDRPPPPRSNGKLALCGSLQDGRIVIAALVGTSGTMPIDARVDLRRIEIDPFVDLGEMLGTPWPVRAWTSGTITIATELSRENAPLSVQLELPELSVLIPRTDGDGRPAPLVVRNTDDSPLSLHFDGKNVELGRPVTFKTPAGLLTVSGKATEDVLDLAVKGTLDLEELEPLLATWFDEVDGEVEVDASVAGTFDAPEITARLDLAKILLRPAGQDTELQIKKATIDHSPDRGLSFNALALHVVDPTSGEKARLTVQGGIKLDGFTPTRWGVIVDGQLAGKMLLAFAPEQLAAASGVADLTLVIQGDGARPSISGDLTFNSKRPIAIMPRGLRREIVLSGGRLAFTEERISLEDISGSIDDEGSISEVVGEILLEDGSPVSGEISLDADGIPFRVPRTLDLVLSARNLAMRWDDTNGDGVPEMELEGNVAIVQGRYVQSFRFDEVLRPEKASSAASKPFWEEYPMLGAAKLDIGIEARSLSVVNNVANIDMSGHVDLTGTPRTPRLDGQISIARGTFKPPFTRARFTRTRGQVSFAPFSDFPNETPTLDITSESDYRDSSGQEHLITLTLRGPLQSLAWDLTTSTGLTKSQTLALILTGGAQEDANRNPQDVIQGDVDQIDPSTNPDSGAADQVIKDVAGDFISLLVADPLKNVGLFDVARLEVGTGSIGFHGERKVLPNANGIADVEQTVRGRTVNVRVEIKSTFGMGLQLGYLTKSYDDPAEDDVQDYEGKLVYRWFIP